MVQSKCRPHVPIKTSMHTIGLSCTVWPQRTTWQTDTQHTTDSVIRIGRLCYSISSLKPQYHWRKQGMGDRERRQGDYTLTSNSIKTWYPAQWSFTLANYIKWIVQCTVRERSTWVDKAKNKKSTNWWGRQNAAPLKFDKKLLEIAFSPVFFSNFDHCRPQVAEDIIFGVAVEKVGMDVHVKFGDSPLNSGQITQLCRLHTFYAILCNI